jgi:hypothetical protein
MKNLSGIILTFIFGAILGNVFGLNMAATGTGAVALQTVASAKMEKGVAYANGFDISDVVAQLGDYFRKNDAMIYQQVFKGLQFEKLMTSVPGVTSQYVSTSTSVSNVLQPHQKAWTPKGEVTFTPRINSVDKIKYDIEIDELETLYDSWLQWLADEGKKYQEWPFVKWLVFNEFIPQMTADIEEISCRGDKAAVVPGTPGGHLDTTDGILTIIADEITATNLTPITVGALSPSTMVSKVETFVDGIAPADKKDLKTLIMSTSNAELYARDYRNQFGGNMDYSPTKGFRIDGTNFMIQGIDEWNGSDRFLMSPSWNMIKMFDKVNEPGSKPQIQQDKRVLNIFGNLKRGYGFRTLERVYASDNA